MPVSATTPAPARPRSLPSPPWPREHGAWVMLLVPIAVGAFDATTASVLPLALLLIAAVSAFMAQSALSALLKPRPPAGAAGWLAAFSAVLAASGGALVVGLGHPALLWLAPPALALLALHVRLLKGPPSKRLDRSTMGELLAAGALTLTGPAASVATRGALDGHAVAVWVAGMAAFASGVLHVNMRLEAVKVRRAFDAAIRWRLGRGMVAYHVALAIAVLALALAGPAPAGWMAALAFAPLLGRAGWELRRLGPGVPSFKAIGMREAVLVTWFAVWAIAALRTLG